MASRQYIPTPTERRRFRALLRKRTAPAAVYRAYRSEADVWLAAVHLFPKSIGFDGWVVHITRAELVASELFERRYLVAYVRGDWPPHTDATVVSRAESTRPLPPLVLIPAERAHRRGTAFRSIVEHEFVHVNQVLMGAFPESDAIRNGDDLLEHFFTSMFAEYEANLLQLTRWPQLYPRATGLTLDRWCALRGYTQSLERSIAAVGRGEIRRRAGIRLLQSLPATFADGFRRVGIDDGHAGWFRERWADHLCIALVQVATSQPTLKATAGFQAVANWWRTTYRVSSA
jgi:hypothetical protein